MSIGGWLDKVRKRMWDRKVKYHSAMQKKESLPFARTQKKGWWTLMALWQPIPVFLPGESQGRWSLGGCHLWGRTESDTTEVTMEKAMVPHSSTLAWKILWTEEPGRLQSMGSLRVGYDWVTSLSLFIFMHWRRKWQPTPVFLPGESQGQGSLVGCRLWGRTESDTTKAT